MCRHSATYLVWQLLQTAGRRRGLTAEEVAERLSLEVGEARRALEVLQMAGVVEEVKPKRGQVRVRVVNSCARQ